MGCWTELIPGKPRVSQLVRCLGTMVLVTCCAATALADEEDPTTTPANPIDQMSEWVTPERISGTLSTLLLVSALSLAPALLLMTTCFVRINIVLAILRQAIGTQGVPSNQVLAGLGLFMTAAIMTPVWNEIYRDAVVPYQAAEVSWEEALSRAKAPLHGFMARQIERTGNADDVWLFLERSGHDTSAITSYDQVPFQALAPAFLLSELKTAFLIGFQIFLPFLVIDLVVASVISGMGLITVPPALVSLPAKLLLFVLVDGWHLIVGMLLDSFA